MIGSTFAKLWLLGIALLCAVIALVLHIPGHMTMDTSVQLEEARLGESFSFNPPFMSAALRWLGGGEFATSVFVAACTGLTYGALAMTCASRLASSGQTERQPVGALRVALATLLIANPVLLAYCGIVWKDVLFASCLTMSLALALLASTLGRRTAVLSAVGSTALLVTAFHARQQGLFMAPCLLVGTLAAIRANSAMAPRARVWACLALAGGFVAGVLLLGSLVRHSVHPSTRVPSNFGYRVIMTFDLEGMLVESATSTDQLPLWISDLERDGVRRNYNAARIEDRDPTARSWQWGLGDDRSSAWWSMLKHDPGAYSRHKLAHMAWVLGVNGLESTPIAVGVEGNPDYLSNCRISSGLDGRDRVAYSLIAPFFGTVLFRHWFWLLAVIGAGIAVLHSRTRGGRLVPGVGLVACILLVTGMVPTSIACDFRYLYALIPLVSVIWLWLLLGGGSSAARPI